MPRQIRDLPPHVRALPRERFVHVKNGFTIVLAKARLRETRSFQLELRIACQELRNERGLVADPLIGGSRERLEARMRQLSGERRNRRAIGPAAERNADGDVRNEATFDRLLEGGPELVRRHAAAVAARLIVLLLRHTLRAQIEDGVVRRGKHQDVFEKRFEPSLCLALVQIVRHHFAVRTSTHWMSQDRLDLAGEDQFFAIDPVMQWLLAESIP